jgi:8-oxo-dGTP pyrophosphatase MutT (NUDIX family)
MAEPKKWQAKASETIFTNSFLRLHRDKCTHPTLGEHNFYVFDFRDWVNIVPVTEDGKMVLVKQYRRGTDEITLEIPSGSMDQGETDPEKAVLRELREETGLIAGEIELMYKVAVNPAIQNNYCYLYLATGCTFAGPIMPDATEELEVLVLSIPEVEDLIARGEMTHSLGLLGLQLGLQRIKRPV